MMAPSAARIIQQTDSTVSNKFFNLQLLNIITIYMSKVIIYS